MDKIILHVDMDAFFASVEQLDNANLRGKPVIVGGVSERGVVATCSYEARTFGIHSAMPIFMAQKLCPHAIYVRPRMYRYKEISEKVFDIFREITPIVEPVSVDEAYLDLSNSRFLSGLEAAQYIKDKVYSEIGLTLSIGISHNKFLAKLASDWNKPNGIKLIDKEMIPEILFPLSISKIHGLGEKSTLKLNNIGIFTIRDLYKMPIDFYTEYLGKTGIEIYYRIHGTDNREVEIERDRKSYGKEKTLKSNTDDIDELLEILMEYSKEISQSLVSNNIEVKTITLKYKTYDFQSFTRSKTLKYYTNDYSDIYLTAKELLDGEKIKPLRLIGISTSSFKEKELEQLSLF